MKKLKREKEDPASRWLATARGQTLVKQLGKPIVAELAPEELDLFDELVNEYFENPRPPDFSKRNKSEPLAAGFDLVLTSATIAVTAAISTFLAVYLKVTAEELGKLTANKVVAMINERNQELKIKPSENPLKALWEIVRLEASRYVNNPEDATRIANAVITRLTMHSEDK